MASHLELVQVDGGGRAGDRMPVLGGPQRAYDWRLDRLGDDVVVAGMELEGSIGVAASVSVARKSDPRPLVRLTRAGCGAIQPNG